MSKTIKNFGRTLFDKGYYKKLFSKQTPGNRIAPPRTEDARLELRIDAGEVINGKKRVYLQVNSQAKTKALKEFIKKYGTHANLAVGEIDEDTPEAERGDEFQRLFSSLHEQACSKLG
ncbi:hypothetical protein UCRPC4_g03442 [Phaeomoniella chlamydospora]|uniref:Uncharacterized protein n=1 Tax=Phaeomoniella chlamydospora TaxID=158046 RepID=A0A0G2EHH3_PHACM|nr:hypothetical protein UCRPC4_g03442 [Phaeomoniella chlamydospora]